MSPTATIRHANTISSSDHWVVTDEYGNVWHMDVSIGNASSPVRARFGGDECRVEDAAWQSTPFQAASACHDPLMLAQIVANYFAAQAGEESVKIVSCE